MYTHFALALATHGPLIWLIAPAWYIPPRIPIFTQTLSALLFFQLVIIETEPPGKPFVLIVRVLVRPDIAVPASGAIATTPRAPFGAGLGGRAATSRERGDFETAKVGNR